MKLKEQLENLDMFYLQVAKAYRYNFALKKMNKNEC